MDIIEMSWRGKGPASQELPVSSTATRSESDAKAALDGRVHERARLRADLGWLPILALTSAAGVTLCTMGDALSRSARSSSQLPFWAGVLVIVVPIAFRLYSSAAGRRERLVLVVLLGLALYLVKVVLDPFGFTFPDELVHAPNANEILRTHHLFSANPILTVTPRYPGLESVAAALSATTGLGTFGAGLIVIGASRLVMMLGLFLLFERVSGSARIASLGAAIYTANANFVFFSAQFSYESIALPLLVLVLVAVAQWQASNGLRRREWAVPAVVATCAITVTHHMTSYALVAALLAVALATAVVSRDWSRNPMPFALFAMAVTAGWLVVVASITVGYLSPVLTRALFSTIHTVSGEAGPRHLFATDATGYKAPLLERAVAFGSVVLLAAGMPVGLRAIWRRYRSSPFALIFALAAIVFFGVLLLRFAPAAWETANRASEFLFIGLAFVLALVSVDRLRRRHPWIQGGVMTGCFAIVFAGGVIAGWPPSLRLSQRYVVAAGSRDVESEPRQLARWAKTDLSPRQRVSASTSDARLLLTYGNQFAMTGHGGEDQPDTIDILQSPLLPGWQRADLRDYRIAYVVADDKLKSYSNDTGYYFGLRPDVGKPDALLDPGAARKFDAFGADRVYDSGSIKVYDVRRKLNAPAQP
jgi:hypothetical protein